MPQVEKLNELLPESDRIPPLDLRHVLERTPTSSVSTFSSGTISNTSHLSDIDDADSLNNLHLEPVEELVVIDKAIKK